MSNYLQLVNRVIEEGGSEMDSLSLLTWSSAEAGRRNYPRIKRNVRDAWKKIQMERFEWVFKDTQVDALILPRFKFRNGDRATPPAPGTVFEGMTSGFQFTLNEVKYLDGAWEDADATGQLEFATYNVDTQLPIIGESFKEISPTPTDDVFVYTGAGSYHPTDFGPFIREPLWETFVARPTDGGAPLPLSFVPWSNWQNALVTWSGTSFIAPAFVSKDFEGHITFTPQSLIPFSINFVAHQSPQILSDPEDVPLIIQDEYHDWIAWEALDSFARFDKNPDLLAYANKWTTFYRIRAERELMPVPSWGRNRYATSNSLVSTE